MNIVVLNPPLCGDEYVQERKASIAGFFIGEAESRGGDEAMSEVLQLLTVLDRNEDVINTAAV